MCQCIHYVLFSAFVTKRYVEGSVKHSRIHSQTHKHEAYTYLPQVVLQKEETKEYTFRSHIHRAKSALVHFTLSMVCAVGKDASNTLLLGAMFAVHQSASNMLEVMSAWECMHECLLVVVVFSAHSVRYWFSPWLELTYTCTRSLRHIWKTDIYASHTAHNDNHGRSRKKNLYIYITQKIIRRRNSHTANVNERRHRKFTK